MLNVCCHLVVTVSSCTTLQTGALIVLIENRELFAALWRLHRVHDCNKEQSYYQKVWMSSLGFRTTELLHVCEAGSLSEDTQRKLLLKVYYKTQDMSTGFILLANTIQWQTTFYLQVKLHWNHEPKRKQTNTTWTKMQNCGQKEENVSFKARNWENTNQEGEKQEEELPFKIYGRFAVRPSAAYTHL